MPLLTHTVNTLLVHLFLLPSLHPEPKAVEEMKGTDQEYSSALTQYNSSANSGGEDIELLAFQTVTGQNSLLFNLCKQHLIVCELCFWSSAQRQLSPIGTLLIVFHI